MNSERKHFLDLSAELTGYDAADLEGTGLVDNYLALLKGQVGAGVAGFLFAAIQRVMTQHGTAREKAMRIEFLASPTLWPVCGSLITLWYCGSWTVLSAGWYAQTKTTPPPPPQISVQGYEQQLAYRAAGAHPPGTKPTGFGSWAIPPVFGDHLAEAEKS